MVHGNPTWSVFWRHLVAGLGADYRCVVPDHMGCGLSETPSADRYGYRLADRVADLGALVEHLDLRDITLLVHDWGGMITLAWALEHLERIRSVVILNTAGFGLPPGKALPWQIALVRKLTFFEWPVRKLGVFEKGALATCTVKDMAKDVQRAFVLPYADWDSRLAVHRFVADIPLQKGDPSFDIVERVSENLHVLQDVPVQLHWGDQDFVFDGHFLAEWRRRLPGAEVFTYPEAGHYVLEDAHVEILPRVTSFLSRS